MYMYKFWSPAYAIGVVCSLALYGCSDSSHLTFPVHGRVTWEGGQAATELAEGTVELKVSDDAAVRVSPRGEVQPDGSFVLKTYLPGDGAPAGKYVAIVMPKLVINDEVRATRSVLDPKYQSFQTTPLTVEVKKGDNEIALLLKRGK